MRSKTYRGRFGEFTPKFGLALAYCRFEEHDSLHILPGFGNFFLYLPWGREPIDGMMDSWGFTFLWDSLYLNWGTTSKFIDFPWKWQWVRTTTWDSEGKSYEEADLNGKYGDDRLNFLKAPAASYTYVLESGKVQKRTARYYVEEREWRWKWFRWLPWPRLIRKTIAIEFSDEVGERTGSWKGGCIGCGYNLLPGETPLACLRRMERERKFGD